MPPADSQGEEAHDEKAGVEQNEAGGYGKVVTPDNPCSPDRSDGRYGQGQWLGQVTGTVVASCQNKGCWMTWTKTDQTMMVSFKDYGFFVPMDMAGKQVVIEGIAEIRTVGVDEQRHLAQDGGASEEEINAITEEKQELKLRGRRCGWSSDLSTAFGQNSSNVIFAPFEKGGTIP